jgi:prepilin-type N-terminal cleavage/methylation domain-containing protein
MHRRPYTAGFTLIEMIVSLGVFAIVATIAVGALLALIGSSQQTQGEQIVMTNLAFALDSMTREIRTGFNFYCTSYANPSAGGPNNIFNSLNNPDTILGTNTLDCAGGKDPSTHQLHGISFYESGNSITGATANRITYFHDGAADTIFRRIGGGPPEAVVSSDIRIERLEFFVTGSRSLSGSPSDALQPVITIHIEARRRDDPNEKPYYLQTTVTQRALDI